MHYKAELFPHLTYRAYLNHAGIWPLNLRAETAMTRLMRGFATKGARAWSDGNDCRVRLREKLARLIGAEPDQIGLTSNTSHGILLVANEYPWRHGDRLVLFRGEFPGNVVPWLIAAERHDLEIIWLDLEDLAKRNQRFRDAMALRPRLMAISWVQFQTGWTQSLEELARLRKQYGFHICLDAIQGLGPLRMDLAKTPMDFVVCGGHKWLMAPEGTAFIYIHPERMAELEPLWVGWTSQEDPFAFLFKGAGHVDYNKPIRREASRVEMATMNSIGYAGMEASLDLFFEIGLDQVSQTIRTLADLCRTGLRALGLNPISDQAEAGIVSVFMADGEKLKRVAAGLDAASVMIATPDGHLRAAPHFYNDPQDISLFLTLLEEQLKAEPV